MNKETSSAKSLCHRVVVVQECQSMREDVLSLLPICSTIMIIVEPRAIPPIIQPTNLNLPTTLPQAYKLPVTQLQNIQKTLANQENKQVSEKAILQQTICKL